MTVTCDEYLPRTVEHTQFWNRFIARVRETGQAWVGEDDFVLQKPRLRIQVNPVRQGILKGEVSLYH
jgi:hypothetical protein